MLLSYTDSVGKREFLQDIILNTIVPHEWKGIELRGEDAQEAKVIWMDIKGDGSLGRLLERVRGYYDKNILKKLREKEEEKMSEKDVINDKSSFINKTLSNLIIYQPMDSQEFVVVCRSLPQIFRENRDVVLMVVDGL